MHPASSKEGFKFACHRGTWHVRHALPKEIFMFIFKFACHLGAWHVRQALSSSNRKARNNGAKHCRGLKVCAVQQLNRGRLLNHIFVLALLEEVRLMFFANAIIRRRGSSRSLCVCGANPFTWLLRVLVKFAQGFKHLLGDSNHIFNGLRDFNTDITLD